MWLFLVAVGLSVGLQTGRFCSRTCQRRRSCRTANVLLTRPNEARWQAQWTLAMAALSIGLGCAAAPRFGAVGVVYASALAILAAQVLPDLLWLPRLVRRRPRGGD